VLDRKASLIVANECKPATATGVNPINVNPTKEAFLPFARPDIGEEEIAEVADSLRSGWITTGPKAARFEQAFAAALGGDVEAIAVNSATAGLHLGLEALGIGPGDEVLTSVLTFTATAEVARYLGADVRFVDIDPVTLNLDPQALRTAVGINTRAILPVHYAGLACDMDRILSIAKAHNLRILEDAAHALPATWRGKLIGTLDSDITVFSFYANKTITTGEGGMIVTRNAGFAKRMRVMRLHGIDRDAFDRFTSKTPTWYYEVVAPGFKYNLPDIAAAMGIHQLRKLDRFAARRRALAERYHHELRKLPLILPASPPQNDVHAWHLYVIRLAGCKISRDQLIQSLADRGIGTSVHYVPLHRQPYWRDRYGLTPEMFPNADAAYQSMISIPLYTRMSDDDQTRVISALHTILSQ
jgi:dTDP-4-amino-4,6-dideoxygalactose transaminase